MKEEKSPGTGMEEETHQWASRKKQDVYKRQIYILSIPILSEIFSAGFSCGKVPERNGIADGRKCGKI